MIRKLEEEKKVTDKDGLYVDGYFITDIENMSLPFDLNEGRKLHFKLSPSELSKIFSINNQLVYHSLKTNYITEVRMGERTRVLGFDKMLRDRLYNAITYLYYRDIKYPLVLPDEDEEFIQYDITKRFFLYMYYQE